MAESPRLLPESSVSLVVSSACITAWNVVLRSTLLPGRYHKDQFGENVGCANREADFLVPNRGKICSKSLICGTILPFGRDHPILYGNLVDYRMRPEIHRL